MAATKMQGRGPSKGGIELYSSTYFGACALGGVLSCGPTHAGEPPLFCLQLLVHFVSLRYANTPAAVTPLDLVSLNFNARLNPMRRFA